MDHPTPAPDTTPCSTPLDALNPLRPLNPLNPLNAHVTPAHDAHVDPLILDAAAKIAAAINDLKRGLDKRDAVRAHAHGAFKLAVSHAQTWELAIVPDGDGDEYPITVKATLAPAPTSLPLPTCKPVRPASHPLLDRDFVARKKRKFDHDSDTSSHGQDHDKDHDQEQKQDATPAITKDHLDKLRDDIQEDTTECVNHVHRLLRRFREEWHDKTMSAPPAREPLRDSVVTNPHHLPVASFPSPTLQRDDQNTSLSDVVRREANLLSTQVRWVEECRRVAADLHDKRQETWRTSSAGFHDRQRQDREHFQNRILHESNMHAQTLNQILNEVKAIGLYAQSIKWETPTSHLAYPSPAVPTPPAFPTQPASLPTPTLSQPGRGGIRGIAPKPTVQPNQR